MNDRVLYWTSLAFGALALLLLVVNVSLISGNRAIQQDINRRQAVINNGLQMSHLNQALAQALAQAAVDKDDKDIRELLAGQGITVKPNKDK